MSYRHLQDLKKKYYDPTTRMIRSMLSWRRLDLDESTGDRATALGREDENGTVESDDMDVLSPVGLIARPDNDATVEALVGYVGASGDHPVVVNTLDHGRRVVIDAVNLEADETIVYTQQAIMKITAAGLVEIRSLNGTAVQLATKADVDAVNTRVSSVQTTLNSHVHPGGLLTNAGGAVTGTTAVTATPNSATATVNGTSVIRGE